MTLEEERKALEEQRRTLERERREFTRRVEIEDAVWNSSRSFSI